MRILMITGDRNFKPGHPRFDLQAGAVEYLEALYWGPGALWASPRGDFFDAVSSQDPFFRGLVGLILARRFKARFNVQVHTDLAAQSFFKRSIARFVLRRADSIRVVSERLKRDVERLNPRASITVLPIFIALERFKAVKRTPDPEPTVLWIGRFEKDKDPLCALTVFERVREVLPRAKLIMLGAGSLESALRAKAAGMPVEFPGWQDPVPFLSRAHVVLSTSPAESWGASIVEALSAGVPVVAPDVGVAKEAGAIISSRDSLSKSVVEVLEKKPIAELKLQLLSKEAWIGAWKKTLA